MWKIKACQITRPADFNAETKLLVLMSHRHCILFILAQGANGVYFGHKRVHILNSLKMEQTFILFKSLKKVLLLNMEVDRRYSKTK